MGDAAPGRGHAPPAGGTTGGRRVALMSRTKKPKPAESADSSPGAPPWPARRVALHLTVAAILAVACAVAFSYMRTYVDQTAAAPTAPPKVVFKNRPAWMTDLLAEQLSRSF